MKKVIMMVVLAMFLGGCGTNIYPTTKKEYIKGKEVEARTFILDCIKNGNPKSDEEPEDWIGKCETFALKLYGTETKGFRKSDRASSATINKFVPCTEANTKMEIEVCR